MPNGLENKPYLEFHIDRKEAARYGIKIGAVQKIIMTAIGGMNLTTTVEGRERFPVRIRYKRELRDNVQALKRVLVPTPKGIQIPLGQLVRIERRPGPAKISSENTLLFSRVFCDVDADVIGLVNFVETAQKDARRENQADAAAGLFLFIQRPVRSRVGSTFPVIGCSSGLHRCNFHAALYQVPFAISDAGDIPWRCRSLLSGECGCSG